MKKIFRKFVKSYYRTRIQMIVLEAFCKNQKPSAVLQMQRWTNKIIMNYSWQKFSEVKPFLLEVIIHFENKIKNS